MMAGKETIVFKRPGGGVSGKFSSNTYFSLKHSFPITWVSIERAIGSKYSLSTEIRHYLSSFRKMTATEVNGNMLIPSISFAFKFYQKEIIDVRGQ